MKKSRIYFTCGPTQLYKTVPKHIKALLQNNILSVSHRGQLFMDTYRELTVNLRQLLNIPSAYQIFYLSSSIESMERTLQNCVVKNSFHLTNGAFAEKYFNMSLVLGKKAINYSFLPVEKTNLDEIKIPATSEMICVTQNETSTGVALPMTEIYRLKSRYPKKLIALDIVSSVPCVGIDFSQLDLVFFSVQKAFGLPAGLSVLVVSPSAMEKSLSMEKKGISTGSYHSFSSLKKYADRNQTVATPNVFLLFLLNRVAADFLKYPLKKIRRETHQKAALLYTYFDKHPKYHPAVSAGRFRSVTTIVVNTGADTDKIIASLAKKGMIVSRGYGRNKKTQIRIANYPSHSMNKIKLLLQQFTRGFLIKVVGK